MRNSPHEVVESGMLDQAQLQAMLDYSPETGVFTWRRAGSQRLAGRLAGRLKASHWEVIIDHKVYQAARLAWLYMHGEWPTTVLRFNDDDTTNVRISNLRLSVPNSERVKDTESRRAYKADLRERAGELNADTLRELLNYDPLTGIFTWRESGSGRIKGQPAGNVQMRGYRVIHIFGCDHQAQRLAWLHHYGEWPLGKVMFDNETPGDCRISNLRAGRTMKEANAVFHRRHPEANRKNMLRRYEGMTIESFDAMLAVQNGVCAICQKPETATRNGVVRWLSVDHDHGTNAVRGLLCSDCNTAIGLLGDSPTRLRAAADYLERNRTLSLVQMKRSA